MEAAGNVLMPLRDVKVPEVGGRIGSVLLRGRWYEQEMLDYIRTLNLPGIYLDVGANIGNHAVYFAKNTSASRVFAFEPVPRARKILSQFVELNLLYTRINVVPFACSDADGEIEVVESMAVERTPDRYRCLKIDTIVDEPVALIKMDIEGAEPAALRGAVRTLAKFKPRLFVEVHDAAHMREIMEVIEPIGYTSTGRVWNASPTYEFVAT